ncbi:hypothetical protein EVAR_57174_1 [Eumeta japonica]|uniref:Uncharacterized protein n=1 Tax=Eumeta variegata TaxID=151549 RepID=A0A4C1ZVK2_EUMVA|nr:hypothetical protein EVAR_57174_1 [Eumeta japonica]
MKRKIVAWATGTLTYWTKHNIGCCYFTYMFYESAIFNLSPGRRRRGTLANNVSHVKNSRNIITETNRVGGLNCLCCGANTKHVPANFAARPGVGTRSANFCTERRRRGPAPAAPPPPTAGLSPIADK